MPSSWSVYYVVFLSAFLALAVPSILALLSRFAAHEKRPPSSTTSPSAGISKMGSRINTRYFLAANAAMLLTCSALVIVPVIGVLSAEESNSAMLALILVFSVALLCGLGLLYASRRGDLSWVKPEGKR